MKRILALVGALTLLAAPVQAMTDQEFAELTVRQVTLDVSIAVSEFDDLGPVWTAPYTAISDFLDVIKAGTARVRAVTFDECLYMYRDTVLLGLALLERAIQVVGEAAGVADDADRAAFSATGPAGYVMLTQTAPALLAVADCSQQLPGDVA